jgi:hypothetical protein
MSGTGHAGMEATIANLVEPGETVLVGNKGIWGMRVADLAARYGANVVEMTTGGAPRSFSLEEIKSAVETHKPALLFLCQGESSMGVVSLPANVSLPCFALLCGQHGPFHSFLSRVASCSSNLHGHRRWSADTFVRRMVQPASGTLCSAHECWHPTPLHIPVLLVLAHTSQRKRWQKPTRYQGLV